MAKRVQNLHPVFDSIRIWLFGIFGFVFVKIISELREKTQRFFCLILDLKINYLWSHSLN